MTLVEFFRENPEGAVALSGGVDSAYLLYAAARFCRRTAAYFVKTAFQPGFELADAQAAAAHAGVPLRVLELDVLSVPEIAGNPPDRCYYCKQALFSAMARAAAQDGLPQIFDGSNASDDADSRPGMRALRELRVRSPLRECGIAKGEVRALAREAGIAVWDKPSYACLATRVPSGTAITQTDLARVEQGEAAVAAMGFTDFRLRLRGEGALLQVRGEQLRRAEELLDEIKRGLSGDFSPLELDPSPRPAREV